MVDSEDDDRRGRVDKFTRERDSYGGDRRRDDDRRQPYRSGDYSNGVKRSAAPRRDDYPYDAKRTRQASEAEDTNGSNALIFLPFKRWLLQQDDSITDEEALTKYNAYKMEHKKQQLVKFFTSHKEEEWFRQKYHPEESTKRKEEQKETIKKRNAIFKELHEKGFFTDISLDFSNAKKIIFLLDAVVVKLEGGTDEDIELLKQHKIVDDALTEIEKDEVKDDTKTESEVDENGETKPKKMQLHKTQALFLRTVEANIKQTEVEEVCMRYPGFLRLCLSEPVPDKKFARRGWATYKRDVNIKQIALNINSIRIRDTDLHAIINKDMTRKIRTVNGITAHKEVAQQDLRLAAKVAAIYDLRSGIFCDANEADRELDIRVGVDLVETSPNPIIQQARSYMGEEMTPEEEELMRMSGHSTNGSTVDKMPLERDEDLLKALDLIILYLRIVHSVDFYTQGEYSNEDRMPNRCGLIHLRSGPPSGGSGSGVEIDSETGKIIITSKFINDFTTSFKNGIEKLTARTYLSEEDIDKLGRKSPEEEMEAFIKANSVELSAEKWLCPLSGKKFKGPEFIRKHLMSKHNDKLEESKQDAFFYNNYLADPSRPTEPETPPPQPKDDKLDDRSRYDDRNRGDYTRNSYGGGERPRYSGGQRHDYGRQDRRPPPQRYYDSAPPPPLSGDTRRDSRPPISYRDLDAPDADIF